MFRIIEKYGIHILIWAVMFLYLVTAHDLYIKFFLSESIGKPIEYNENLPTETESIASAIDNMVSVDQDIFELNGWVLLRSDHSNSYFEKMLVLQSNTRIYFFAVKTTSDVKKLPPFSVNVSSEFLQPGIYRVGFLFRSNERNTAYYSNTDKVIIRTPNSLRIEDYKE